MRTHNYRAREGRLGAATLMIVCMVFFILVMLASQVSAQVVNGNSGRCLSYNGTTSNVTFTNNNLGLGAGNTMTVTAWVKCNSTVNESNYATMVALNARTANGNTGQFWFNHSSNNSLFEFAVENTSNTRVVTQSVTAPVNGVWYHVAGVYDGSFVYIYVNGVMESKAALTGNINSMQNNFALNFGQWAFSGNNYRRFNGEIDEVTVWNTALSQNQIRTNMCQSLKGIEAGLVGYWTMNETSGTTVYDKTVNGRNGTSANTTIIWSGAPIGNASSFTYGGSRLSLKNPTYGDSLVINSFSSTPTGAFIYRVDTMPNFSTPPAGYSSLAANYYYGVFIVGAASPTYTYNYYYTGNLFAIIPAQLGVASRYDDSASTWSDIGVTHNFISGVFQKTGQSGRNEYDLAQITSPLPIKLSGFSAVANTDHVDINWTTSTEVNNSYFTIERSTDGLNFEEVIKVTGAGNSDVTKSYSAVDPNPVQGTAYYRLRQIDFNGHSETFPVVAVNFAGLVNSGTRLENAYPNPFKGNITLDISCNNTENVTMEIVNINGMVLDKNVISCAKGSNSYEYTNGYMLPAGTYFICLTDELNGQKTIKKIVKA